MRVWAKRRGLYANKMGYLGGVNFNILVAMICQVHMCVYIYVCVYMCGCGVCCGWWYITPPQHTLTHHPSIHQPKKIIHI